MISIFLAQVWGLYLLVMGIGILINAKAYKRAAEEIVKSPAMMLFSGAMALMLGIVLIVAHTVLIFDWRLLVTLLGWLTLYKGVMRIIFPESSVRILKKMLTIQALRITSIASIVLGLFLSFIGFYWVWS